MHGEPAEARDAAPSVRPLEPHRAGALSVHFDDEEAERLGVALGALDLRADLVVSLRANGREERLDVLVRDELDQEVGVVGARASDRHAHAVDSCARTPKKRCPEARTAPATMSAKPAIIAAVTGSSSRSAPYATANAGMRYVTIESFAAPVQPEHAEEEELARERRDEDEAGEPGERRPTGHLGRRVHDREREQHHGGGEHVPRREDGSRDVVHLQLPVDAAARVRERREDDRERPGERPPSALRREAGEERDAEEADRHTDDSDEPDRARAGGTSRRGGT